MDSCRRRTRQELTLLHNRYMAVTQFAATHARMAFPCVDEPNRKSTFDVTLNVLKRGHTALSNMELQSTTNIKYKSLTTDEEFNAVEYKFGRTPSMSSYVILLHSIVLLLQQS
jgi:aminopeptidase N